MANLLTVPSMSHCLHEGLADGGANLPRLRARLTRLPSEFTGNADTGLIHYLPLMLETFPDARLVLLMGNDASWKRWSARNGLSSEVRRKVDRDYDRAREHLQGRALFLDCRALTTDVRVAQLLWDYCIPLHPFEPQRWEVLKDLNIQVKPESLARRLLKSLPT